jgi:hypothetical protein
MPYLSSPRRRAAVMAPRPHSRFWRNAGLWTAALVVIITETRWSKAAIWTMVFVAILICAFLLGPGH